MKFSFFKKQRPAEQSVKHDNSAHVDNKPECSAHNKKFEQLGLYDLLRTLPWRANGIYLEDKTKQVKAVCSSEDIARVLANCVDHYSSFPDKDMTKMTLYKNFMQDAYYLYIAMSKAKIPVNTLETAFVEKAFHSFCKSFGQLLEIEHLRLDPVEVRADVDKTTTEVNNKQE